jgi:hypothetical protein
LAIHDESTSPRNGRGFFISARENWTSSQFLRVTHSDPALRKKYISDGTMMAYC